MEDRDVVRAAGALCWRRHEGSLQVLLVHHALNLDWSWPKGKPEPDEPLAVCAVREVGEEAGVGIALTARLPGTRYVMPDGRGKAVRYWAARVATGEACAPSPEEIDEVEWLDVAPARARLTRAGDAAPLDELVRRDAAGSLDTWPLLVLRHASAIRRGDWDGEDADRTLRSSGERQARSLAGLLACWHPQALVSSPWTRCRETVAPFAAAAGLDVRLDPRLTEDGDARQAEGARAWVDAALQAGGPLLACTHRPVLPALMTALRERSAPAVARRVPHDRPRLVAAEVAVLHVTPAVPRTSRNVRRSGPAEIVAVERHRPA